MTIGQILMLVGTIDAEYEEIKDTIQHGTIGDPITVDLPKNAATLVKAPNGRRIRIDSITGHIEK